MKEASARDMPRRLWREEDIRNVTPRALVSLGESLIMSPPGRAERQK